MRKGLAFSHVGIYVQDLAAMTRFYAELLDFAITDAGKLEGPSGPVELVFLSRDPAEHHQIVLATGRPEHVPFNVINQISLRADSLATLRDLHARRNLLLQGPERTSHPDAARIDRDADAGGKLDGSFANSAHAVTR